MFARIAAFGILMLTLLAVLLFGVAGRIDWPAAWLLLALLASFLGHAISQLTRRDPDLVRERMRSGGPAARGDNVIMGAYRLLLIATFVTAALDAGRYRWSRVPATVQAIGGAAIVSGFALVWWCMSSNRFLSSVVRVQHDRGHRVIDAGPYRYVRHPMYAGLIALVAGMALLLGSWLALAPAALVAGVLMLRIALEERVLVAGLDGYGEYRSRVRARLVPGVW